MRPVRPIRFTHAPMYASAKRTMLSYQGILHRALGVGKAPTQPQHSTHLGVGVPAAACTLDITMPLLMPRPITAGHRSRSLSIIMLAMEPVAGPRIHYATVLNAFHTL